MPIGGNRTFGGMMGSPLTNRQRQEQERQAPLRIPVSLDVTNVGNSNVTLWTVTDGKFLYVEDIGVCNISGGALAVTVYVVPSGGAAANANKAYDALSVSANTSQSLTALEGRIFAPGTKIIALTNNATGGNFWLSGYESTGGDFL